MYHIKEDKRCLKSAKAISEAFGKLLMVKSLTDITVSDIQRASGVGRSTFYRLFDNIDDVLYFVVEEELRDMLYSYQKLSWHEFTGRFIGMVVAESHVLINIASSGKLHVISRALRVMLTEEAEKGNYKFDDVSKYTIAMYAGCCLSLISAWDEGGRQEPIDELADMMQEIIDYKKIDANLTRSVSELPEKQK